MAMIRNVALAVPRLTGHHEITRTLQRIAADRTRILPILATFPLPKPTCQQLCNWPEGEPMPCPRTNRTRCIARVLCEKSAHTIGEVSSEEECPGMRITTRNARSVIQNGLSPRAVDLQSGDGA
jgi:hypothetical protein